jgi:hypothetical protein
MAVKQVYLSAAGADAEAYAKVNKKALTFLHFGIGSGENPSPENCEMIDEKYTMPITTLKEMGDGIFKIRGVFSNENLTEDFIYRELALYIKNPKNESQTILYCYGNAKTAQADYTETIPAFSGSGNKINRMFDIDIRVTGGSATFEIDDSAKADVATVQEIRDDLTAEIEAREAGDTAAKNLANATGTLAIEHGGTGATSDREAQYNLLNNLEEMKNTITDEFEVVGRFITTGNKTNGAIYKFKALLIWNYIKGKIKSVLGLDETEYKGNSASATTLKGTQLAKGTDLNNVLTTGEYYALDNTEYTNAPCINFSMRVIQIMSSYKYQILYAYQTAKIYGRSYYFTGSGNVWSDWKELVTKTELINSETTAKNLANATGTLSVAKGGTGATTAKGAQKNLLTMSESTNAVSDSDLIVQKYTSPTEATGTLLYKKASAIWTYIQSKISSVLGLTATAYGGKAATAGTADTAKALSATYIKGLSISGKTITYTKGDNTTGTLTTQDTNTTYNAATQSAAGLMSAADKAKLDGITAGASSYTHPTTSGNKHIPSGGANNQVLGYSADGTAQWAGRHDFIYTCSTAKTTREKTVALTGFKLEVGACIRVRFTNGNGASNPTLNVNNTGAKEIRVLRVGEVGITPFTLQHGGRNSGAYYWNSNITLELIYDGTYWLVVNNPVVKYKIDDNYMTKASSSESYSDNVSYRYYIDGYKEQWGYVKKGAAWGNSSEWNPTINFDTSFYDKMAFCLSLNITSDSGTLTKGTTIFNVNTGAGSFGVKLNGVTCGQTDFPIIAWNAKGY